MLRSSRVQKAVENPPVPASEPLSSPNGTVFEGAKPVPRLTTEGPFRHIRNPAYLGLAMISAGIAVLRNAPWTILLPLVFLVIQREVIGREERCLERTFGEEHLDYKRRVRR